MELMVLVHELPSSVASKIEVGDCWIWTASRFAKGYGQGWNPITKRNGTAHRLVWELLVGPIGRDMTLDHLCRVRHCVNPDHLEEVTMAENRSRGLLGKLSSHCRRGHKWTKDNSYINPTTGYRFCRKCKQLRIDEGRYA